MNYKHLILTRFNLQYDPEKDIHIHSSWLDERFRLFELYCLPSIVGQTCQQFDWVIFVSDQTPEVYQQRLLQLTQASGNIHIELCPYYQNFNDLYKSMGEKYIGENDFLLSTRIDSDDMLAANYVEILHNHISASTPCPVVITFTRGIQWFEHNQVAFGVRYNKNHFLNFWEKKPTIQTSLSVDHTLIHTKDLLELEEPDMWCEIVHQSNLCNSYVPKYRYSLTYTTKNYPIRMEAKRGEQWRFLLLEHVKFRYHQLVRWLKKLA